MRNAIDFSSWQGVLSTLLGLVLVSLVAVGIRLLVMHSVQQRRERQNRQINERLKTLIAGYKVLGGSFTGDLSVDPSHLRELRQRAQADAAAIDGATAAATRDEPTASDRRRRTRDAVEAALSDVILLGTEEQVRLAVRAAMPWWPARSSRRPNWWCRFGPSSGTCSIWNPSPSIWPSRSRARCVPAVRAAHAVATARRPAAAEVLAAASRVARGARVAQVAAPACSSTTTDAACGLLA
jgi:hypothetical protein